MQEVCNLCRICISHKQKHSFHMNYTSASSGHAGPKSADTFSFHTWWINAPRDSLGLHSVSLNTKSRLMFPSKAGLAFTFSTAICMAEPSRRALKGKVMFQGAWKAMSSLWGWDPLVPLLMLAAAVNRSVKWSTSMGLVPRQYTPLSITLILLVASCYRA